MKTFKELPCVVFFALAQVGIKRGNAIFCRSLPTCQATPDGLGASKDRPTFLMPHSPQDHATGTGAAIGIFL